MGDFPFYQTNILTVISTFTLVRLLGFFTQCEASSLFHHSVREVQRFAAVNTIKGKWRETRPVWERCQHEARDERDYRFPFFSSKNKQTSPANLLPAEKKTDFDDYVLLLHGVDIKLVHMVLIVNPQEYISLIKSDWDISPLDLLFSSTEFFWMGGPGSLCCVCVLCMKVCWCGSQAVALVTEVTFSLTVIHHYSNSISIFSSSSPRNGGVPRPDCSFTNNDITWITDTWNHCADPLFSLDHEACSILHSITFRKRCGFSNALTELIKPDWPQ